MYNYSRLTDEQLVAAYAKGVNQAFDTLLARHQDSVYAYIFKFVKNPDIADDIFQETFMKVISTIRQNRYTESGKFKAWVIRVARNLIIDFFRQEKSDSCLSIDRDDVDVLNRKSLSDPNIEDKIVSNQILADVKKLMKALPETQRQVLEMRFYLDMSFKEIAEATGVSINTALGRMRYALIHIRKLASENHIELTV